MNEGRKGVMRRLLLSAILLRRISREDWRAAQAYKRRMRERDRRMRMPR